MRRSNAIILLFLFLFSCKTTEIKQEEKNSESKNQKIISKEKSDDLILDNSEVIESTDLENYNINNAANDERFNFEINEKISKDELNNLIKRLFEAIEEKIATGDFNGWYSALSYKNKKHISDKTTLLNMSRESDYLYSRKITLETPKDYFLNIVMPSRKGYTLAYKGYEYIDKKHIKVNCVLDDTVNFVYDFIYEDNSWKVDRR